MTKKTIYKLDPDTVKDIVLDHFSNRYPEIKKRNVSVCIEMSRFLGQTKFDGITITIEEKTKQ